MGFAADVHMRYDRYKRYATPAYFTATKTAYAVCASAASPVAATVSHMRSPMRKPAMNAGAPRVPRASERATIAATPGPGEATARPYTRLNTARPYNVIPALLRIGSENAERGASPSTSQGRSRPRATSSLCG